MSEPIKQWLKKAFSVATLIVIIGVLANLCQIWAFLFPPSPGTTSAEPGSVSTPSSSQPMDDNCRALVETASQMLEEGKPEGAKPRLEKVCQHHPNMVDPLLGFTAACAEIANGQLANGRKPEPDNLSDWSTGLKQLEEANATTIKDAQVAAEVVKSREIVNSLISKGG